jgi:hypothetical protein
MNVQVSLLRLSLLGLFGIGALSAQVQGPPPQGPQRTVTLYDGGTDSILQSIDVPPIANAPFSGMLETEWLRPLADGGTWTVANRRHMARDSAGRLYQERWALTPKGGKAKPQMTSIQIADPAKHTLLQCNPRTKTCEILGYWPTTEMAYRPSPEQSGQLKDGAGIYVHEKIGENTIQGLPTIGMRDTTTINVGIIGNDREFSIVREFWYSPKLGFNLLSSLRDARFGTQSFKMTELTEGEPEGTLFEMPQGYAMAGAKGAPAQ